MLKVIKYFHFIDNLFGPSSKVEEEDDGLFGQDDSLFAKKSGGLFSGGDSLFDDQEEEVLYTIINNYRVFYRRM
jgi:hypothetical protein